ncbi:2-C-methyl-D-erythritol 4-phosphate cytidylyltransferase/2-C-methyl-D-erythritol 4-phosphate cytidylyltransferase / 2-C-methyl-D-erythritol 2,4-cyclodiphosphate synthase [Terribacillus aidingensis]|uniref:2-C-methyl-D-erythritol 4-phosphate cytidylyltransferase n=1 Tax=Terribacillus aidingensis TaxID=586416 RepID=A0A285P7R0_9BACI|nr:2-C-methyl-D-erythritol 4-phosphate cytidylyltransferase [Terribacillus aidingensis]SNZ17775.1 2-C-methyl-D-erythritol 4-phosphate cytidylyltransferase/2-C-methyl-D-erythritol 4-phosphate cytidylyltransferase / 2-C-methyl-D-erythritol 2,4-cyclodiphosphate synthase [Terribacillus aidingensis]
MYYQAIVLAAGQGKRMQAGHNKQFLTIGQKPLIVHTLTVFDKDPWCESITLVVSKADKELMAEVLTSQLWATAINMADGGSERQESVLMGLEALPKNNGMVFIHDGARPFVTVERLHALAEACQQHQAALLAVPVTDTIKVRRGNRLETMDRGLLWAAQTPQAFDYQLIYDAHVAAKADGVLGTDDASLVERLERDVFIVEGSYDNIKLTTPEDLYKAEAYLNGK